MAVHLFFRISTCQPLIDSTVQVSKTPLLTLSRNFPSRSNGPVNKLNLFSDFGKQLI